MTVSTDEEWEFESPEKLARLLAEHLHEAEQGIEQVLLLLDMPDQQEAKRAEWLSLAAAWNLKHRHDQKAARGFLERLVRDFPNTPQAMAARRRLAQLQIEMSSGEA